MEKFNDHFLLIKDNNSGRVSEYNNHLEANEYNGCEYFLKDQRYIQRTAKLTPKKIGQFVTLWKRNLNGITTPLDINDNYNYVVIICFQRKKLGSFLFPKEVLVQQKIISNFPVRSEGKRGFRVYPKWDTPTSKQAIETQRWQLDYFVENLKL